MGGPRAATRAPLGCGAGYTSVSARAGSCDRGAASSQRKLAAAPRPGHWRHHGLAALASRHAGSRHADSARAAATALVQKQSREAVELVLAGCGCCGGAGDYRNRSRSAKHADMSPDTSRGCHLETATEPPRRGRMQSIVHQCPIHCPFIFHEVAPIFHTSASKLSINFLSMSIHISLHFPHFPSFPHNVRHGCSVVAPCCNPFSIHASNALSRNFPSILHTFSIIPCPSKFLNIFINAPSFPSILQPFCPSFLSG